jgi:DNA-binding NarL/FixJ family response regulator
MSVGGAGEMAIGGPEEAGLFIVVDDDPGARALVVEVLRIGRFRVYQCRTGEEALESIRRETPDGVILDVALPGISGFEVCSAVREEFGPEIAIIFLSGTKTDPLDQAAGLLIGADDYMLKPFEPDELLARVRAVLRRSRFPRRSRFQRAGASQLTPRELEVLRLLAEGLDQKQIAERLVLSPKTVGNHIDHILHKLQVRSRSQAIAVAYREQLLE